MKKQKFSEKSKITALLLCLFFGMLGAHLFYTKYIWQGVFVLIATLTGIGMIVSAVVVLIDLIKLIAGSYRDKEGLLLK
jgi:TM2 domain-containing membrane protein YozV